MMTVKNFLCSLAVATAIVVSGIGAAPIAPAMAAPASCAVPPEHTALPKPSPTARPQVGQAATPNATPIAQPRATEPSGSEQLTADLGSVANALAACLSANDAETVVKLTTPSYLGSLYGLSEPLTAERYLAAAAELDPIPMRIVSLTNVEQRGTGSASAEVLYVLGNQLVRAQWEFVLAPREARSPGKSAWQVNTAQELSLKVPSDSDTIEVTLKEYAITLEPSASGPDVVLNGTNTGALDHEMLVLRLVPGYNVQDLLKATGPGLPDEVTFVGQRTVPAGDSAQLILTELPKGSYLVTSLFSGSDGMPELAKGMSATFTVR